MDALPDPCCSYNKSAECRPFYGKCVNGQRYVPVKMLDVAGLVPGASEGKVGASAPPLRPADGPQGLGNKFLDDLRTADVLLHIVDVSGTTNEKVGGPARVVAVPG